MVNLSTNNNKTTISSYLTSINTKETTTYDIGNPGPGLGPVQKRGFTKRHTSHSIIQALALNRYKDVV